MGVKSCFRKDCDNIMCDTYVANDIGYICFECQNEFKEYLTKENITVQTRGEIFRELKGFMETRKDDYIKGDDMSIDEFFDEYTD